MHHRPTETAQSKAHNQIAEPAKYSLLQLLQVMLFFLEKLWNEIPITELPMDSRRIFILPDKFC